MSSASARRAPFGRAVLAATAAAALTFVVAPSAHAQSLDFGSSGPAANAVATQAPDQPTTPPANTDVSHLTPSQQQIVDDIATYTNAERAKVGVRPVTVTAALTGMAQRWSEHQASDDRMYHNPDAQQQIVSIYGTTGWAEWGENVLQNWNGVDGKALVAQWMASPPHRINLLNAFHRNLGVGLAVAPSGKLYSTQNFVG